MKLLQFCIISILCFLGMRTSAQADSSALGKTPAHVYTHYDSVYMARLNSNGNLMIAAGVGLCGVGSFLIYEGNKTYTSSIAPTSTTPTDDLQRNHRQGTIYYAAGGIAIAGGIVLVALGAKNKVDFKLRKKMMEMQAGLLDNGNLGATLTF